MVRQIRKTIAVRYSHPVRDCVRRLMILPREGNCRWQSFPPPDEWRETRDEWHNRVLELRHQSIARDWNFALKFEIDAQNPSQVLADAPTGAWRLPSALCPLTPQIQRLAASASTYDVLQTATELNRIAHRALRYAENVTNASSSAQDALNLVAGVCQDFAHLFIAMCRVRKIAARYVSGYGVRDGRMHAWAEIWDENQWRAFDPTEGSPLDSRCVAVAYGRDYRDVMPHSGQFRGRARAVLHSHCTLQVLAEDTTDAKSPISGAL